MIEVMLVQEKETKNKIRFEEQGSSHIGTLYVPKVTLQQIGNPQFIKVTIENVDGGA